MVSLVGFVWAVARVRVMFGQADCLPALAFTRWLETCLVWYVALFLN